MLNEENAGKTVTADQTGNNSPEMFTKERVNELMKRRIERSHQSFFNRYGVKDLKELDDLFGKAYNSDEIKQQLEESLAANKDLQSKYDDLTNQHSDLTKRYAFNSKNINPEKYSDIETYFKGKNLDINEDTLSEELKTHQDWVKNANVITSLGSEVNDVPSLDEKALASRYLGVDLD